MSSVRYAEALNSGNTGVGLYLTPVKKADRVILDFINTSIGDMGEILHQTSSILVDSFEEVVRPDNCGPFMSEAGLEFARMCCSSIAYENARLGATQANPIPILQRSGGKEIAMEIVLNIFCHLQSKLPNGLDISSEFKTDYLSRARQADEHYARSMHFSNLTPEEKAVATDNMCQLFEERYSHRADVTTASIVRAEDGTASLSGVSGNLEMPEREKEPPVDNVTFDDVQQRLDEDERIFNAEQERKSKAKNIAHGANFMVGGKSIQVEAPRIGITPVIVEERMQEILDEEVLPAYQPDYQESEFDATDASYDDSLNVIYDTDGEDYGDLVTDTSRSTIGDEELKSIAQEFGVNEIKVTTVEDPNIGKIEASVVHRESLGVSKDFAPSTKKVNPFANPMSLNDSLVKPTILKSKQEPKSEEDTMYNYRDAQAAKAAGTHYQPHASHSSRPAQQPMYGTAPQQHHNHAHQQPAQQRPQLVEIVDAWNNNQLLLDASGRAFLLPEDIAPRVAVTHAVNQHQNTFMFDNNGAPILLFMNEYEQMEEWFPQTESDYLMRTGQLQSQGQQYGTAPQQRFGTNEPQQQPTQGYKYGNSTPQTNTMSPAQALYREKVTTPANNGGYIGAPVIDEDEVDLASLPAMLQAQKLIARAEARRKEKEQNAFPVMDTVIRPQVGGVKPTNTLTTTAHGHIMPDGLYVRLHNNAVLHMTDVENVNFRSSSATSFGKLVGRKAETYVILIGLDSKFQAVEIIVDKEELMDRAAHLGQFETPYTLEANEGTVKELLVREEEVTERTVSVELADDMLRVDSVAEAVVKVKEVSETLDTVGLIETEIVERLACPTIPEEFHDNIKGALQVADESMEHAFEHGVFESTENIVTHVNVLHRIMGDMRKNGHDAIFRIANERATRIVEDVLRYKSGAMRPEIEITDFFGDFDDIPAFLKAEGMSVHKFHIESSRELRNLFNIFQSKPEAPHSDETEAKDDGFDRNFISLENKTFIVTSEVAHEVNLGRIEFDKEPELYKVLVGAFKCLNQHDNSYRTIQVATELGELVTVTRLGSLQNPVLIALGK